ncbi:colibactin polyketide synthase ClbC [Vibrio parahaemolyticus]|uniref:beta-ketoacyl synthase N-terminal-like domain-containing protein n=1 Tax=Vibrio sp. M250220 TaxID=3020894 RepID=UPI002853CF36|nr:colibactin polyketide synthase ClbC [Vibrio parahaemolyticus]ELC3209720.1 hypothetical protein [Vibrio parahaemolyticus]
MTSELDFSDYGLGIAIVGMAVRLPRASSLEEYWQVILNKKACQSWFSKDELIEEGIDPDMVNHPDFLRVKPIISGVDSFDADFFGYSRTEAMNLDSKTRVFHEVAYHALEHAGYGGDNRSDLLIGVFAGASEDPEWLRRTADTLATSGAEQFEKGIHAHKDLLAQLVAYHLDLHGPAYSLYTACSTSLSAVQLAAQSLLFGECDIAVSGGVTIDLPIKSGYLPQKGMIHSLDGYCRPFDKQAKGTLFGDGACAVVMKRLQDAVEDGDQIHAVLRGISANNDGHRKVGFSAPSFEGQKELIERTMAIADVDASTIGYVETHGTGTSVGDPVEFDALVSAFRTVDKSQCALGSVKANIGHTHAAAGVAGLIKAVLAVKAAKIPPMANFQSPNENLTLEQSPFYIPMDVREWCADLSPRRAAISSFGIGGTNVHAIVEQAPNIELNHCQTGPLVFPVSTQTQAGAKKLLHAVLDQLHETATPHEMQRLAFSLQTKRRILEHREAIVAFVDSSQQWSFEHIHATTQSGSAQALMLELVVEEHDSMKDLDLANELSQLRFLFEAVPNLDCVTGDGLALWLAAVAVGMMEYDAVMATLSSLQSGDFLSVPERNLSTSIKLCFSQGDEIPAEVLMDDGYWLNLLLEDSSKKVIKKNNLQRLRQAGAIKIITCQLQMNVLSQLDYQLAEIWLQGYPVKWASFYDGCFPVHLAGPAYPFTQMHFPIPHRKISGSEQTEPPENMVQTGTVASRPELSITYRSPKTQTEMKVVNLMEVLLGIAPVGLDDDFFELGGHSLLATRLALSIEKCFSQKIDLADLLETPTAASICRYLRLSVLNQNPEELENKDDS